MDKSTEQPQKLKGYPNCPTCDGFGMRLEIAPFQSINWETAKSMGLPGKKVACPSCRERRELESAAEPT